MSERLDDRIRAEVTASSDRLRKRRAPPDELLQAIANPALRARKSETRRDGR